MNITPELRMEIIAAKKFQNNNGFWSKEATELLLYLKDKEQLNFKNITKIFNNHFEKKYTINSVESKYRRLK